MYLSLKLLHILSATLLFGTGLGTAFYMWRADRSHDVATVAAVSRQVVLADWLFTAPAVVIQFLTGLAMVEISGYTLTQFWILSSLVLFFFIGACWLPVVWIQMRIAHIAAVANAADQSLGPDYRCLMRWWYGLGWPAFSAVLVIFYLMVFKPVD